MNIKNLTKNEIKAVSGGITDEAMIVLGLSVVLSGIAIALGGLWQSLQQTKSTKE